MACGIALFLASILLKYSLESFASKIGTRRYIIDLLNSFLSLTFPQICIAVFAAAFFMVEIAVGTVMGYSIAVAGFLLPITGIFKTYELKRSFIKFEIIIIILITVFFETISLSRHIKKYDIAVLFIFFIFFTILTILKKKSQEKIPKKYEGNKTLFGILWLFLALAAVGIIIVSSYFIVYSSMIICSLLKINIKVFSLTVIPILLLTPRLISLVKKNSKGEDINPFIENILQSVLYTLLLATVVFALIKPVTLGLSYSVIQTPFMFLLFVVFTALLLPRLKVTRLRSYILFTIYLTFTVLTVINFV